MRKFVIISLLAIFCFKANSQNITDSILSTQKIELELSKKGPVFIYNDTTIKIRQVKNIMAENQEALRNIRASSNLKLLGNLLLISGGLIVGQGSYGEYLYNEDPNWAVVCTGLGLAALSFPIRGQMLKKAEKAVDIYNSGLPTQETSFWLDKELELGISGNGLGVVLRF